MGTMELNTFAISLPWPRNSRPCYPTGTASGTSARAAADRKAALLKTFDRLRDKSANLVLTAHIGAHEFGRGAKGMQFVRQRQAGIVMASRDNEVAAFACKSQRGGASDSGQRTCDQDDLSAHV